MLVFMESESQSFSFVIAFGLAATTHLQQSAPLSVHTSVTPTSIAISAKRHVIFNQLWRFLFWRDINGAYVKIPNSLCRIQYTPKSSSSSSFSCNNAVMIGQIPLTKLQVIMEFKAFLSLLILFFFFLLLSLFAHFFFFLSLSLTIKNPSLALFLCFNPTDNREKILCSFMYFFILKIYNLIYNKIIFHNIIFTSTLSNNI